MVEGFTQIKYMSRYALGFFLFSSFFFAEGLALAQDSAKSNEIIARIAVSGPFSQGGLGVEALNGVRLGFEDIVASGIHVNGHPVKFMLVQKDDDGNRDKAVEVAKSLVARGNVLAVVGHLSSVTSIQASSIYASNKIIQISPGASSPVLKNTEYSTFFKMATNDVVQGEQIGELVAKGLKAKNVLLIKQNNSYSEGIGKNLIERLKKDSINIVLTVDTTSNAMDVLRNIPLIRKEKVDAAILLGVDSIFADYAKAMRRAGMMMPIVLSDGNCTQDFLDQLSNSENLYCTRNGAPVTELGLWPTFVDRYKKAYGESPTIYAAYAYDSIKAVALGVRESGSLIPEAVASSMHANTVYGITGMITFGANGDRMNGKISVYESVGGGWSVYEEK